jgi:hypothetical protein
MWPKALIKVAALLTVSTFAGGARLQAQDREPGSLNRPAAVREQPLGEKPPVVTLPTENGCALKMTQAYEAVLAYLNSTPRPSSDDIRKAALEASGIDSQDLSLVALTHEPTPDFLVGCSCFVGLTDTRGTFRVFKAVDRGYLIAARSEDQSILTTVDGDVSSIDNASLDIAQFASQSSHSKSGYFATTWTRGGGRPAPFSVIAWEWDGQVLNPVWSKLELRGTVDVIGPVIVLSKVAHRDPTGADAAQPDVFRVEAGAVLYEGKLDAALLKRYTDEKIIAPQSSADYIGVGGLWQSAGDDGQAATLYQKAITLAQDGEANYLYLAVADIYEQRGEAKKATKALQNYQKVAKEQLGPQIKQELNQRIMGLQTKSEQ